MVYHTLLKESWEVSPKNNLLEDIHFCFFTGGIYMGQIKSPKHLSMLVAEHPSMLHLDCNDVWFVHEYDSKRVLRKSIINNIK